MTDTCEQKARNLLERLSNCTYYDDPQQLSAGDVVELAQMFAEVERLRAEIEWLRGLFAEIDETLQDHALAIKAVFEILDHARISYDEVAKDGVSMKRAVLCAEAVAVVCPDCGADITNEHGTEMWLRKEVDAQLDAVMQCPACDVKLRMPTSTRKVTFE